MKRIKIKVCGMKYPHNMLELGKLPIDFMGIIFYPKSVRYINNLDYKELSGIIEGVARVGVFVNEDIEVVKDRVDKFKLDFVQLHGEEDYDYCLRLNESVQVIKAFPIATPFDMEAVNNFGDFSGYFLFDTKTSLYGGSGTKFDWTILDKYRGSMPFLLSGGISESDIEDIKSIKHPKFEGIDINSRFETEPGLKNIDLISKFVNEIRA